MATIHFYEKPGCINNTKQKALLVAAGHNVQAHNLLTEPWTTDQLRSFFGDRPITECFNRSAPAIKSGEVIPEELDTPSALALMVQNPLLIRRPLIEVGDQRTVGFHTDLLESWIGLQPTEDFSNQDLETCPHLHKLTSCTLLP